MKEITVLRNPIIVLYCVIRRELHRLSIYDIFSKRQKKLRGEIPDVYIYDNTPATLRRQIVHIWNDAIYQVLRNDEMYDSVVHILQREYGEFRLPSSSITRGAKEELLGFFLNEQDNE